MTRIRSSVFFTLILLVPSLVHGASREALISTIENRLEHNKEIALKIWNLAELGYLEVKSTALLQQTLTEEGFRVESGVAGIPTSFIAEAGSGKPVIAVLAEFDALPGIEFDLQSFSR